MILSGSNLKLVFCREKILQGIVNGAPTPADVKNRAKLLEMYEETKKMMLELQEENEKLKAIAASQLSPATPTQGHQNSLSTSPVTSEKDVQVATKIKNAHQQRLIRAQFVESFHKSELIKLRMKGLSAFSFAGVYMTLVHLMRAAIDPEVTSHAHEVVVPTEESITGQMANYVGQLFDKFPISGVLLTHF